MSGDAEGNNACVTPAFSAFLAIFRSETATTCSVRPLASGSSSCHARSSSAISSVMAWLSACAIAARPCQVAGRPPLAGPASSGEASGYCTSETGRTPRSDQVLEESGGGAAAVSSSSSSSALGAPLRRMMETSRCCRPPAWVAAWPAGALPWESPALSACPSMLWRLAWIAISRVPAPGMPRCERAGVGIFPRWPSAISCPSMTYSSLKLIPVSCVWEGIRALSGAKSRRPSMRGPAGTASAAGRRPS
mmetsp:Transcript_69351/g.178738  ORF Transcript_69351/g.178738 Transcript_69351/m.178738 type:complete len:249 (+) Transcript_69351:306-1052(+)